MTTSGTLRIVSAATLGAAGTGGAVYFGSKALSYSDSKGDKMKSIYTFGDKFVGRLVTVNASDNKWKIRLDKLNQAKIKSPREKGLPELTKQDDLHQWCINTSSEEFDAQRESVFESFCVLMNKEQISESLIQSGGQWKEANERIGKVEDSKLSPELKEIKNKVKANATSGTELKDWCVAKYDLPFKGDRDFEYVKLYCTEIVAASSASPSGP
ncbi:hypothetical protein MHC_02960 [Mycoplasma haemocanis str. Illinois]|uniref:Uncharacterized protein n=1 Tax=Mycoplasma haemocanis (strain Illinois) TaxID=1111676 RepID=H6N732_MYCHN|nr:hypothetical protein [Mycoplasma haemocanis]AEW45454.1 hypothetical protein MHC_02960 [Mycoplasma haemocanis str. Illinois]